MEYIEANHQEWHGMWEELSGYFLNDGDPVCLNDKACWEYMGSTQEHHHFKHPLHPNTGKAEFVYIERRRAAMSWANQKGAA